MPDPDATDRDAPASHRSATHSAADQGPGREDRTVLSPEDEEWCAAFFCDLFPEAEWGDAGW